MFDIKQTKAGFTLVVMLMFLLILSLLVLGLLNNSVLESRALVFYQNKIRSFYMAEQILIKAEQHLKGGLKPTGVSVNEFVDPEQCGIKYYRFTAIAAHNGIETHLESVWANEMDSEGCSNKPKVRSGRHSFTIKEYPGTD